MIDFEKLEELKTILEFSTALTEEFAKETIVADEGNDQGVDSGWVIEISRDVAIEISTDISAKSLFHSRTLLVYSRVFVCCICQTIQVLFGMKHE